MKKINWGKLAMIGTALLAVGGIAYYLFKKLKVPKKITQQNPPPKVPSPTGNNIVVGNNFPLQSGSNNNQVKQLQTALGVTADGAFGPNTLAALQSQYGISSVPNQSILTAITNGTGVAATNRALAQSLSDSFGQGGSDIYVNTDYFAQEVTEVATGSMSYTGYGFQMTAGETYDGTVYTLNGATLLGMCVLVVLSGTLQSEYLVDPNCISLTPVQLPASSPISNPVGDSSSTDGVTPTAISTRQ